MNNFLKTTNGVLSDDSVSMSRIVRGQNIFYAEDREKLTVGDFLVLCCNGAVEIGSVKGVSSDYVDVAEVSEDCCSSVQAVASEMKKLINDFEEMKCGESEAFA